MKTVVQIILSIAILLLGYLLYDSVMKPIRFNKELANRGDATVERLKDIRKAQVAYKSENGTYTGSFDSLINFINEGNLKVVIAVGSVDDSAAVAAGLVRRDTILVAVKDSLFKNQNPDMLRYVPGRDGLEFEMAAAVLETGSKVKVPVFEAKVHYEKLLAGLTDQLIINIVDEKTKLDKYPGLKVGDIVEPNNNAGNWE